MHSNITLATRNALSACAAFTAGAGEKVWIISAYPGLGEYLCGYLQESHGIRCSILPNDAAGSESEYLPDVRQGFTLALIQPSNANAGYYNRLLTRPDLHQLLVLRAGWLGRRILPEWDGRLGDHTSAEFQGWRDFQEKRGWLYREIRFGNLSSLAWGFLGGRMQALSRPDLADHCGARVQLSLFPAPAGQPGPAYLTLTRAVRVDAPLRGFGAAASHQP